MATTFAEDFSALADETAISNTNTQFDVVTAAIFTADTAKPNVGAVSCRCAVTASAQSLRNTITTVTTRYLRTYIECDAYPTGTLVFWNAQSGTATSIASVAMLTTGAVRIRDGATTIATSTSTLALSTTHRLEWAVTIGATPAQTLRLFLGPNRDGTVPDETISGAITGASFDRWQFGSSSAFSWTYWVGRIRADDTSWVGPDVAGPMPRSRALQRMRLR